MNQPNASADAPDSDYDLVVFDFDGTLVNTTDAILAGQHGALNDLGQPPPSPEQGLSLVGLPLDEVLTRLGAPAGRLDEARASYRAHFDRHMDLIRPYDGVRAMLDRLGGRNLQLAIATSRHAPSLLEILAVHDLAGYFVYLGSGDNVQRGKPHPEMLELVLRNTVVEGIAVRPSRCLMVGDTTYDIEMGRAAGVVTCAVTWGVHSEEELRAAGATVVADKPDHVAR